MPRGFIPISKVNEDDTEAPRNLSPWLQNVSNQLAKKQESIVEQARVRANMINQVNNILKNPPRYATVDDAVQDMRERTGLNEYLKNIKASTRDDDGLLTKGSAKSIVAQIESGVVTDDVPDVLKKYDSDAIEDVIVFVRNNIENSHGLAATIPQLQYDILHVLGPKYRLQAEDIMSSEMARFIDKFIMEAQSKLGPTEKNPHIGEGVGRSESFEDENQDYWAGMMPKT
jgi:hypothetical protein